MAAMENRSRAEDRARTRTDQVGNFGGPMVEHDAASVPSGGAGRLRGSWCGRRGGVVTAREGAVGRSGAMLGLVAESRAGNRGACDERSDAGPD